MYNSRRAGATLGAGGCSNERQVDGVAAATVNLSMALRPRDAIGCGLARNPSRCALRWAHP